MTTVNINEAAIEQAVVKMVAEMLPNAVHSAIHQFFEQSEDVHPVGLHRPTQDGNVVQFGKLSTV